MYKTPDCIPPLVRAGISREDSYALRRIAMTLHRWHDLECGDGNDYASWCITRGRKEGKIFIHDENGTPFLERHPHSENRAYYDPMPDRERGALKRLAKIMARYPRLSTYVQRDPRGAPLYILRPGDVPEGEHADAYYNRGLAVYR